MDQNKLCFRCNERKSLSKFYKHPRMEDGHLNKCIQCAVNDAAQRRQFLVATNPEWVKKEKFRCRVKDIKIYFKIKNTQKYKEKKARAIKKYTEKYPERKRAVSAANNAVRAGKIIKKTMCERCGVSGIRLEKHHADYSKPLEVEFLCRLCHNKETWDL